VSQVYRPMDRVWQRPLVDSWRRYGSSLPECALGATTVSETSPAVGENQERCLGILTEGSYSRCSGGGRLVVSFLEYKWLGIERDEVECGKAMWGRMEWCVAPFIGSGRGKALGGKQPAVKWILTRRAARC
jgi:hypothetical protein